MARWPIQCHRAPKHCMCQAAEQNWQLGSAHDLWKQQQNCNITENSHAWIEESCDTHTPAWCIVGVTPLQTSVEKYSAGYILLMNHPALWKKLCYHMCHFLACASLANLRTEAPLILSATAIGVIADATYSSAWVPGHGKGPVCTSVTYKVIPLTAITPPNKKLKNPHCMAGIKPRSLGQKFLGSPPLCFLTKQFIYLLLIYLWKGYTIFIWEKCCICCIFPIFRQNLQNEEMCLCFWKLKS